MESNIFKELDINIHKKEIISFVGAGGKSATLYKLSKEISKRGKKSLISTTTKIFLPGKQDYNNFFLKDIPSNSKIRNSSINVIGEKTINGKLIGPSKSKLENIISKGLFDFYLVESDGANRKPIKAPGNHEPVVLESTTKTLGLIGLDSLGGRLLDISHRPEILGKLLNKDISESIGYRDIVKLVLHKSGLFKGSRGENILILNKASSLQRIESAKKIKNLLYQQGFKKVIIADILTSKFY